MVNGKDEDTNFLELLMFNHYTTKGSFSDEDEEMAMCSFRLQLQWYKNRKIVPKKIKDLL